MNPRTNNRRWWVLTFALLGNMSVFSAVTMMNTAVPSIQTDLGMSDDTRQWIVTLFSLVFGASILVGGRIADAIGLKLTLVIGLVGFAAASLFGGVANSIGMLLGARALQGATGALVAASAMSIISVQFPDGKDRQRAFATLGVVMGAGAAVPFLLSGFLLDVADWRWCFYVTAPLTLIAASGILASAPKDQRDYENTVPVFQAILLTIAMGLLAFGLDAGNRLGWTDPVTIASLIAAVVLGFLFLSISARASVQLIPFELVTNVRRSIAFISVFALGFGMFAGMWILTAYMQGSLGYSAMEIGFAFIPFAVTAVISSLLSPRYMSRQGGNTLPIAVGLAMTAVALATFGWLTPNSSYVAGILPAMLLIGAGANLVMVGGSEAATRGAGSLSGTAGSVVNGAQQIGAAIGTAVLTSVALATERGSSRAEAAALVDGYNAAGIVGAAILGVVSVGLVASHMRAGARSGSALRAPGD